VSTLNHPAKFTEASAVLGCSRATFSVRLHRAIGRQMQRVDELDYRLRDRWQSTAARIGPA